MWVVAFFAPWIALSGLAAGVLVAIAVVVTLRAAARVRSDIERKPAGVAHESGDVVALRGRLRVEGEGCESRWGDRRKVAAHSYVVSRRRLWPKDLHISGTRERCGKLWLDTEGGPVLIEGAVGVEIGSRLRFGGRSTRDQAGRWFDAESVVLDGDEVVAAGVRKSGPDSRRAPAEGYRGAASRDVLSPLADGSVAIAAVRSWPALSPLLRHPVVIVVAVAALVPAYRTATHHDETLELCAELCLDQGTCVLDLARWTSASQVLEMAFEGDVFTCVAEDDRACWQSAGCRHMGFCSAVDGDCVAARDEDCAHIPGCRSGTCGADEGMCKATRDEDCRATSGCEDSGYCSVVDGWCGAATNEDCSRSYYCRALGHCSVVGTECKAAAGEDCARAEPCVSLGWCTARDGGCVMGSNEDCGERYECRRHGACTHVEGEGCIVDDAGCARSEGCAQSGECRASGGRCVSDATPCKASAACRVYGRCEGEGDCIAVSSKDCEASEGCKEHGACRLLGNRCAKSCADLEACRRSGLCAEVDGQCRATDEACRKTELCRTSGLCTAAGAECVAGSDRVCAQSAACAEHGRCTRKESGVCIASGDDCLASRMCRRGGYCQSKNEICQEGGGDDHCRQTASCKALGACTWSSEGCAPGSHDDCAQSDLCAAHGWCKLVDNRCFISR